VLASLHDFSKKMGLEKPTTFLAAENMKALDTPSIGGKINAHQI
jgi:hypothetical protein